MREKYRRAHAGETLDFTVERRYFNTRLLTYKPCAPDRRFLMDSTFLRRAAPPAAVVLAIGFVAAALIVFNGGIAVGWSNHVGLLPVVRRLLDAGYLPGDFNIELRLYHHRTFAWMIACASAILGEDRGIILIHLICITALSAALYCLCRTIGLSTGNFILIGLLTATSAAWTGLGLEENNFVGNREIQPPPLAHAFVLAGAAMIIKKRWRRAAFLAGCATLVHLQIGVIFTLLIAPFYAARLREFGIYEIARLGVIYLAPCAPVLIHFAGMLGRGVASGLTIEDLNFRMPHHFALASTEAAVWTAAHLAATGAVFIRLKKRMRPEAERVRVLFAMSAMLAALAALHFADYYYFHWVTTLKPQFPRLSPLITVFGAVAVVALIRFGAEAAGRKRAAYIGYTALFALACWHAAGHVSAHYREGAERFGLGIDRYAEGSSSWIDICRWIRTNGPKGVTYLAPPGRNGFTYLSDRSSVVEFKINPDGGQMLDEWYERLRDFGGGSLPDARGGEVRRAIDRAYAELTTDRIIALGEKYGAGYAVLPRASKADLPVIYQNREYRLVRFSQ
ncbi:MAG: hypothetical protein KIT57_05630 [Blastocatellales bacterium]|nr:hypothetical protein [Blastocatellales bacterium]